MSRYALMLINQRARRGAAALADARKLLESNGFTLVEADIDEPGSIGAAIRRHRESVNCVIVGGGDGTLNSAAEALIETGLPLGVLPLGTANDFARTLEIPPELPAAVAVIVGGLVHRIDVGRVNDRYFLNAASLGLSVWVAEHVRPEVKKRWGALAYALTLIDALRAGRPFGVTADCDGQQRTLRAIQVTVGNGVRYGGGLTLSEDAAIDDGWLNLLVVAPLGPWRLVRLAFAFRTGRFRGVPTVRLLRAKRIRLQTRRRRRINTDGEVTTTTPATFEVVPAALSVFVPPSYLARRSAAAG